MLILFNIDDCLKKGTSVEHFFIFFVGISLRKSILFFKELHNESIQEFFKIQLKDLVHFSDIFLVFVEIILLILHIVLYIAKKL